MLVYGDRSRRTEVAETLEAIAATLRRAHAAGGAARGQLLTTAFLEGAGLAQGLIDAEFEVRGQDDLTPLHVRSLGLAASLARGLASHTIPRREALAALSAASLPASVGVNVPEGYAFYAVYPEACRQAAAAHPWSEPPLVIGLRSIGVGLGAVVGLATGAKRVITLRPCGPPFARQVRPSQALRRLLVEHAGPFAIVDEGPGLSGSSFGCVADLLEELGVGLERIVFLPSHGGGLGPEASPAHRARWARARRLVRTLDDLLEISPIETWFADLTGPVLSAQDLSGGAWRGATGDDAPANPSRERRKFRIVSQAGAWLARFAGLGRIGEAKYARAKALSAAGFAPEPIAFRDGFLLERWELGESAARGRFDRPGFLTHLAHYLAFRAQAFPASAEDGASGEALCRMALRNAGVRLPAPELAPRVHVDGKLQLWEWLRRPDGGFCKLDALDHSCAHDLIGCQPIAWDVAGAVAEFALSAGETEGLLKGMEAAGGPRVDPATLPFFNVCYAAFHLGVWTLAADAPGAGKMRELYARRLAVLGGGAAPAAA